MHSNPWAERTYVCFAEREEYKSLASVEAVTPNMLFCYDRGHSCQNSLIRFSPRAVTSWLFLHFLYITINLQALKGFELENTGSNPGNKFCAWWIVSTAEHTSSFAKTSVCPRKVSEKEEGYGRDMVAQTELVHRIQAKDKIPVCELRVEGDQSEVMCILLIVLKQWMCLKGRNNCEFAASILHCVWVFCICVWVLRFWVLHWLYCSWVF